MTENEKNGIRKQINQNQHEIYILSIDQMDKIVHGRVRGSILKSEWKKLKDKVSFSANYLSATKDTILLSRVMADLGIAGSRAYIKYYGGKPHIILKGHPGMRKIFTGTKYGLTNAKVIRMGLGKYGAINSAKAGGLLTIVLVTIFRVVDYFLTDTATLSQLLGTLATDVVKVGIATGAAIGSAALAASVGAATGIMIALGPLAVAIFIGVAATVTLEYVDEKFRLTEKVIAILDEIDEKGLQGILDEKKQSVADKGRKLLNDAVESVVDYAAESVQSVLKGMIDQILRRSFIPQI